MKHLIVLGVIGISVLAYRWGLNLSTPRYDGYYIVRAIGGIERLLTRVDFWLARLKVEMIDRLELDRLAWIRLRARYTPEMS